MVHSIDSAVLRAVALDCLCRSLLAAKNFVKPVAKTAINYPAHDFHRDEKAAIAADPYDTPEKAKIFSVDFAAHGFLPIFFIVTNDGDQPISIANMDITLHHGQSFETHSHHAGRPVPPPLQSAGQHAAQPHSASA